MVKKVIQIKSGITINVSASVKIKKKHCEHEKNYIWNPPTWNFKNGKYLTSIIDDSIIKCCKIEDAEAKSYDETKKQLQQKQKVLQQISSFYLHFFNYHCFIDSC